MQEAIDALFDFGTVTATKVASTTKQILASIRGNEGDGGNEERPYQPLWGLAPVLWPWNQLSMAMKAWRAARSTVLTTDGAVATMSKALLSSLHRRLVTPSYAER